MVQFNPQNRSNAGQLLKRKVFNRYRKTELEKPAPYKIFLEIDQEGVYDYVNVKCLKYNMANFRKMMEKEVVLMKKHNHNKYKKKFRN